MKKETKFTPGPWEIDPEYPCDIKTQIGPLALVFSELDHGEVFTVPPTLITESQGHANAALIASAPAMYAALESCIAILHESAKQFRSNSSIGHAQMCDIHAENALKVLALARGETQETPSE